MNKNNFHIVLKWGAIMGAGSAIVLFLRDYTSTLNFYPFGPIMDVLMILVFFGCLYVGIKQCRDTLQNQMIKLYKAFLVGGGITLIAVVLVFIYLLVNYSFFDKNAVDKINSKNEDRYYDKIKKDTISMQDIAMYLDSSFVIIDDQKDIFFNSVTIDSNCLVLANNKIDSLKSLYKECLLATKLQDTSKCLLFKFDDYSQKAFTQLYQKYTTEIVDSTQMPCVSALNSILLNSAKEMKKVTPLQMKFEKGKSDVIHLNSVLGASLFYSFPILIYGLLFDLFVSLFLFRKKPDEIVEEEKADAEKENQNIEN
jgi:hypothetical protein